MRIIGGELGGRTFRLPGGISARPTGERVRESLFAILRDRTEGAAVLDLFAGSGALGMEALSRGAEHTVFCDSDIRAVRALMDTLARFGVDKGRYEVLAMDFRQALAHTRQEGRRFDLALLDPPYASGFGEEALGLIGGGLLRDGGVIVLERTRRLPAPSLPGGLKYTGERRYGDTMVCFIGKESEA